MKRLLSVLLLILLLASVSQAAHGIVANTQNSFVVPFPATLTSDFFSPATGLTMSNFTVKAYKRNKAPVTVTIAACVFATSTLTNTANPANNETFTFTGTLNGSAISELYTFKTTLTGAANEIKIAASATLTFDNVKCAINNSGCTIGTDYGTGTVASQLVNATTKTATTLVVVANIPGTGPNAYTTAETSTVLSWTGATLASGNDNCMIHESNGRHWFAGPATLFDTVGPMSLVFNIATAMPFEYLLDVQGQTSWNARHVSVSSIDDSFETDCSTVANTSSPFGRICGSKFERFMVAGTAQNGSTTTLVDSARTEADTDYWVPGMIVFTSGNIAGQVRYITGFNAATDTLTFAPALTQAVTTQTYEIRPIPDFNRGTVTVGTNNDKSGYALTQAFPTNFSSTVIDASGRMQIQYGTSTGQLSAVAGVPNAQVTGIGANVVTGTAVDATAVTKIQAGMLTVPKNTQYSNFVLRMFNSSRTPLTGLTVSCQMSKDGAALAACTNAVSEISGGAYKTNIAAGDLNVNQETYFIFTAGGAVPVDFKLAVQH